MATRAEVTAHGNAGSAYLNSAGISYLVQTPSLVLYLVYVDATTADICFRKSTDNGLTWSAATTVAAVSAVGLSVWYDRWSGISGDLIHCAYIENTGHDVLYRSINAASSDALSTETTIFNGVSATSSTILSITRARGGNLGCYFSIDAGAEDGFARSTDVGATWAAGADPSEAAFDYVILMPGWATDNQDLMMFFWDISANEISRKLYDDSADSWAETSISLNMTDVPVSSGFPHFAATVDTTNSRNILAAWNGVDTLNADLNVWWVTESAITAKTNAVNNSTDDQGLVALGIDTNSSTLYAFYFGKSDGSETYGTSVNLYYKSSTDFGVTWGSETLVTAAAESVRWLTTAPRFAGNPVPIWLIDDLPDRIQASVELPSTGAQTITFRRYFD